MSVAGRNVSIRFVFTRCFLQKCGFFRRGWEVSNGRKTGKRKTGKGVRGKRFSHVVFDCAGQGRKRKWDGIKNGGNEDVDVDVDGDSRGVDM